MKIGINTLLFAGTFTDRETAMFADFKRLGFDGVEIALEKKGDLDYPRVLDELARNGLACSSLCGLFGPDRDLRGPDPKIIRNAVDYIKDCIDACAALKCEVLGGPCYSAVGRADLVPAEQKQAQWRTVVAGLKEVCAYAEDKGVYIAVEPLNRFETDFLNICADAVRLAQEVASPRLKIHLDTFHMNIEEKDSAKAVLEAGQLLYLLHASENDRGAPGSGQVHWKEIARALKKIKYNRWVVIESFTPEVKVIAKAASIWRQTEKDALSLAGKGLKFLRSLL